MNLDYIAVIVSILSAVIAVVAIVRAREANRIATDANKITRHFNLRPMRLDSCNLLKEFVHYCTTYHTKFLHKMVSGTNELMDHRDNFKKGFEALGPLGMTEVEVKAKEFMKKAIQLQGEAHVNILPRKRYSAP